MALNTGRAGAIGRQRRQARQEAIMSLQETQRFNNRMNLLHSSLPGFTDDPDIMAALAGAQTDEHTMITTAIGMAGDNYMTEQVEWLNELPGEVGEAYFNQMSGSMQTAIRGAGYMPYSEVGDGGKGFWGRLGSGISVPFTGRVERALNHVLPGDPFDGRNVNFGMDNVPGAIGLPIRAATTAAGMPFRAVGKMIDGAMWLGDSGYRLATRVYRTGIVAGDRNSFQGYDEQGRPIYRTNGWFDNIQNTLTGSSGGPGVGAWASGIAQGIMNPSSLAEAWGDASDGEETFKTQNALTAARILEGSEQDFDVPGTNAWLARKVSGGHTEVEIMEELGYSSDHPEFLSKVQDFYSLMGDEKFQEAVDELNRGKISFGRETARAHGLDPTEGMGKWTSGAYDAAFMIVADPLNLVGGGVTKARYLTRWRIAASATRHGEHIGRLQEMSQIVRAMDDAGEGGRAARAALSEARDGRWYTMEQLRTGTDVRQARRTNAKVDRIVEGFRGMDEAEDTAEFNSRLGTFLDENADLVPVIDRMMKWNDEMRAAGRTDLRSIDGVWDFLKTDEAHHAIRSTKLGGTKKGLRRIPQHSSVDDILVRVKMGARKYLDPAKGRQFEYVDDIGETIETINRAINDGTFSSKAPSLLGRLRSQKTQFFIDDELAPNDVDELLNWQVATNSGATRRFIRSFFEHTNAATRLELDAVESVAEFRRLASSGALSHMPQSTIDEYIGAFTSGNVSHRAAVVEQFIADVAYRSGFTTAGDMAVDSFWGKFVGKYRQSFSIGGRDVIQNRGVESKAAISAASQGDDVVMIPNFAEMAKATQKMNMHRMMFNTVQPGWIDKFIRQIWSPLQLIRIGFIPRAAGEEILAWMVRASPLDYVQSKAAIQAVDVRRRRDGTVSSIDDARELTVLRPVLWAQDTLGQWMGVRSSGKAGKYTSFDIAADTRARADKAWSSADDAGKAALVQRHAEDILAEKSWRAELAHWDGLQAFSSGAARFLHQFSDKFRVVPSKQQMAKALATWGSKQVDNPALREMGITNYGELRMYAADMMLTDTRISRGIADFMGSTFSPYFNTTEFAGKAARATGEPLGARQAKILPTRVDISNFREYSRAADMTEFMWNYSSILDRFRVDPHMMAGIEVLNRYIGRGSMRRLNRHLDASPIAEFPIMDPAKMAEFTRLGDELGDLAVRAEEIEAAMPAVDVARRAEVEGLRDEAQGFFDNVAAQNEWESEMRTLYGHNQRQRVEAEIAAARRELDEAERSFDAQDEIGWEIREEAWGEQLHMDDLQKQINRLESELARLDADYDFSNIAEIRAKHPSIDSPELELEAAEVGRLEDGPGMGEFDYFEMEGQLEEATRLLDEIGRAEDLDRQLLEVNNRRTEIRDAYRARAADLTSGEFDRPAQLRAARGLWQNMETVQREAILDFRSGDMSYNKARAIISDDYGRWLLDNQDEIGSREWDVLTKFGQDTESITDLGKLRHDMQLAIEKTLRAADSPALDRSLRTVLDDGGALQHTPKTGHAFTYSPVISTKSMRDVLAMTPDMRTDVARRIAEKLQRIGYSADEANKVAHRIRLESRDTINSLVEVGMHRRRSYPDPSDTVPVSHFSHTDSRVADAIVESYEETLGWRPKKDYRVAMTEVPKRVDEADSMRLGLMQADGGYVLSERRMMAGEFNPMKVSDTRRMKVVEGVNERGDIVRKAISGEPDEGWKVVDEIVGDGTPQDLAIRKMAQMQVEEILDTLSTTRRGNDEVFTELTTSMVADDMDGLSPMAIQQKMQHGMDELPQHVYGPTLIGPESFSIGNVWNAFVRGAFDDVIAPAIGSLSRQPIFVDNLAEAIGGHYDRIHMFGPDSGLIDELHGISGMSEKMFDDVVTRLWDMDANDFALAIDPKDKTVRLARAIKSDGDRALREWGREFLEVDLGKKDIATIKRYARARHRGYSEFRESAFEEAFNLTTPYIDDHRVRSQFQQHIGGLMPFWFAEEQFLKRWARGLYENPFMLRKMQIAMHGFRQMGFIQKDSYDNDVFVWPGSEYGVAAITGTLAKVPIFGQPAMAVTSNPMSSQLDYMIPGVTSDAPEGFQFGPGFAIQMNFVAQHFPEFSDIRDDLLRDAGANRWDPRPASEGSGTVAYLTDSIIPSWAQNVYKGMLGDESHAASSQIQAMQYLVANGYGPDETDPLAQQAFMDQTRETARMVMLMRGLTNFTLGSSANVMMPNEVREDLLRLMNEGDIDYLDAVDLIVQKHGPDATVWSVFPTESASGALIPSTVASLEYMEANGEFLRQFDMAGAWFLPQDSIDGEYGIGETRARNTALANELRIRRSPEDMLRTMYVNAAAGEYYEARDNYQIARLTLESQDASREQIAQLDDAWKVRKDTYLAQHPVFAEEISTPVGQIRRDRTIEQARLIVANPDIVPDVAHKPQMIQLMTALVDFRTAMDSISGENSTYATDLREQWRREFYNGASAYVAQYPELQVFFNSVVRHEIGSQHVTEIEFGNE